MSQGYINKILAEKLNIFVIVYLDIIFIYIKNLSQGHVEAVRLVLDLRGKMSYLPIWRNVSFIKTKCNFKDTLSWLKVSG